MKIRILSVAVALALTGCYFNQLEVNLVVVGDGELVSQTFTVDKGDSHEFEVGINTSSHELKSIEGCGGKLVKSKFIVEQFTSSCTINVEYVDINTHINATSIKVNFPAKYRVMPKIQAYVGVVTERTGTHNYQFNDVSVAYVKGVLNIFNRTSMYVDKVVIEVGDKEEPYLLELDSKLPPFSNAKLDTDVDTVIRDGVRINVEYQAKIFLPSMIVGAENDDDPCSKFNGRGKCLRPALGNEISNFNDMAANIHYSLNTVSWKIMYDGLMAKYIENKISGTPDYFSEMHNYTGDLPYSDMAFLRYAAEGHILKWQVYTGGYLAEGFGSGYLPNMNNFYDRNEKGGHIQIWDGHIMESSSYFNDNDRTGKQYKTMFHESSHAYAFSHSSGMTYGVADRLGWDYIGKKSEEWRKSRRTLTNPNVYLNTTYNNDYSVDIEFMSLSELPDSEINLEIMSHKTTDYIVKRNEKGFSLQFTRFPESEPFRDKNWEQEMNTVVFLRAYSIDDPSDTIATIKFDRSAIEPRTKGMFLKLGSSQLLIPDASEYDNNIRGYDIRSHCYEFGGWATRIADLRSIKTKVLELDLMSQFPINRFWSADEPSWEVVFGDDFVEKIVPNTTPLLDEASFMCIITNQ